MPLTWLNLLTTNKFLNVNWEERKLMIKKWAPLVCTAFLQTGRVFGNSLSTRALTITYKVEQLSWENFCRETEVLLIPLVSIKTTQILISMILHTKPTVLGFLSDLRLVSRNSDSLIAALPFNSWISTPHGFIFLHTHFRKLFYWVSLKHSCQGHAAVFI